MLKYLLNCNSLYSRCIYTLICFVAVSLLLPLSVMAQAYGEGAFGSGVYNTGELTPTSVSVINNNSPGSNSSPPGPSVCHDAKPAQAPQLFQVDLKSTSATLYFVPGKAPLTYYYISFGSNLNNLEFGTQFNSQVYPGVQKVTVNSLKPNTKYYFKIRGGNGCMPGDWSNLILTRTTVSAKSPKRTFYLSSQRLPIEAVKTSVKKPALSTSVSAKVTSVPTPPDVVVTAAPVLPSTKTVPPAQTKKSGLELVKQQIFNFFKNIGKK